MADRPSRGQTETTTGDSRGQGWGSPLPAEYGSLARSAPRRQNGDGVATRPRPADGRVRSRPSRPPKKERWEARNPNVRKSTTATSTARRSVLSAVSEGAPVRLFRELARSVSKLSRPSPRPVPGTRNPRGTASAPRRANSAAPSPLSSPAVDQRTDFDQDTRVVTNVDVYSVAKVSIVFYMILLVIFVVASILLWLVADLFGAVDSIQRSVRSLFDVKTFVLHPVTIALYASAAGAILAVAGTIANVLAAVVYNLISEVVGGIRIGVSASAEDEL
jgi:positive regulator of sigma E activity